MVEAQVRATFAQQAIWCEQLGSSFTSLLVRLVGERIDRSTEIGRRVLDWPGEAGAYGDALALRFAAALHGIVRAGAAPALAALYPPAPLPASDALWQAIEHTLRRTGNLIGPWIDGAPQTNEVARSAALMAGLRVVADATRRPLALFEVGASAGLNLLPDRYRITLGGTATGPAGSAVTITPDWTGPAPPLIEPDIVARRGVDLNPLDPSSPTDRARMLAYIWPDQAPRLARIEAALAIAAVDPPPIDRGDAAEWVEAHVHPHPDYTAVLMHSIAYQYFPAGTQARIAAHMADRRVAWLRYEVPPPGGPPELCLRLPDGDERLLGRGSSHLHHFTWLAGGP